MTRLSRHAVTCAVCGAGSDQTVVGSTSAFWPPDLDGRPAPLHRFTMAHWVQRCPGCGYCWQTLDENPCGVDAAFVRQPSYRDALAHAGLAGTFAAVALVHAHCGDQHGAARAILRAAWACDDVDDDAGAVTFRRAAASAFDAAADADAGGADPRGRAAGVLARADIDRRTGRFEEAVRRADAAARTTDDPRLRQWLLFEAHLARQRDDRCHDGGEAEAFVPLVVVRHGALGYLHPRVLGRMLLAAPAVGPAVRAGIRRWRSGARARSVRRNRLRQRWQGVKRRARRLRAVIQRATEVPRLAAAAERHVRAWSPTAERRDARVLDLSDGAGPPTVLGGQYLVPAGWTDAEARAAFHACAARAEAVSLRRQELGDAFTQVLGDAITQLLEDLASRGILAVEVATFATLDIGELLRDAPYGRVGPTAEERAAVGTAPRVFSVRSDFRNPEYRSAYYFFGPPDLTFRAFRALCQHVVGRSGLARGDEHGPLALAIIRDLAARLREIGFLPLKGGSWLDGPDAGAAPPRPPRAPGR